MEGRQDVKRGPAPTQSNADGDRWAVVELAGSELSGVFVWSSYRMSPTLKGDGGRNLWYRKSENGGVPNTT
ncbi:hypothetical protein J6590_029073 [Homalodisca vitripennis]|nr:hypothetical protein J6590_029073 [Homalodisca vitripennis]